MVVGFKNTEIGIIPNDWEIKSISDVSDVDPDNLSSGTNPDYRFQYISIEDVDCGILRSRTELTYSDAPSRARRKIKKNDILISTVRPNLKSHLLIQENVKDWICSTGFSVLRCKSQISDSGYLFNHFFSSIISKQIENLISGSNYPSINSKDVKALKVPLPPTKAEQTAIATALNDVDALITQLEKLIAKKKAIKQGTMQELLKPKEGWETKKLGDIFVFKQGVQCPVEKQLFTMKSGLKRFIRIIDLTQTEELPRYILDPGSSHHIRKEDLFMVRYGTPGLLGYGFEGVIANNLFRMLPKTKINSLFFKYLLSFKNADIVNISSSTTMAALNFTALKELSFCYPIDIEIQKKVALILSDMDNEILRFEDKLEKQKQLKQGMMQSLLTGKIRLV